MDPQFDMDQILTYPSHSLVEKKQNALVDRESNGNTHNEMDLNES